MCAALQFASCLLWALPEALIGVSKIKCKDDSNHLLLVRFFEIQLSRGSKRVRSVRNAKKIKAPTDSIIFGLGERRRLRLSV